MVLMNLAAGQEQAIHFKTCYLEFNFMAVLM